jgi:hypothetical protein
MKPKVLINSGPSSRGSHRISAFLRCPQLFAYEQILKLDQSNRGPLVRGSIGHVGLAHHFARKRAEQRGEDPNIYYTVEESLGLIAHSFGEMGMHFLPIAARAVTAFIAQNIFATAEVLEVEKEAKAWLRWEAKYAAARPDRADKKYLITQRFDLVERDGAGKVWIIDHKFVSNIQGKTVSRYTLSAQFHLMQWFGHALYGEDFAGARINLIECQDSTDKPVKMKSIPVEPAPHAVRNYARNICDMEERIADLEAQGRDPMDYPMASHEQVCISPYGKCSFFAACCWGKAGM